MDRIGVLHHWRIQGYSSECVKLLHKKTKSASSETSGEADCFYALFNPKEFIVGLFGSLFRCIATDFLFEAVLLTGGNRGRVSGSEAGAAEAFSRMIPDNQVQGVYVQIAHAVGTDFPGNLVLIVAALAGDEVLDRKSVV